MYASRGLSATTDFLLLLFLALRFIHSNVLPQDLRVRLSCRPQQTKIAHTIPSASHTLPSRISHGQRNVSPLTGCYVMYLTPYCAGVTQYISITNLQSRPCCEDMRCLALRYYYYYFLFRYFLLLLLSVNLY